MDATEEYIKAVEVMNEMNRVIREFDSKCSDVGYTCTEEAWEILHMVQNLTLSFLNMGDTHLLIRREASEQ